MFGKVAMSVAGDLGRGTILTVISVTMPKVPSEPINKCIKSNVVTNFLVAFPTSIPNAFACSILICLSSINCFIFAATIT